MKTSKIHPKLRSFNSCLKTFGYDLGVGGWEVSYSGKKAIYEKETEKSTLRARVEVKPSFRKFKIKYMVYHPSDGKIIGGSLSKRGSFSASQSLSRLVSVYIEPFFCGNTEKEKLLSIYDKYRIK